MTKQCEAAQAALVAGEGVEGALASHVEGCADCRALARTAQAARTALSRAAGTAVSAAAQPGLETRLAAGAARRLARGGGLRLSAGVAGAVAVAAAAVLWLGARERSSLDASVSAATATATAPVQPTPPDDDGGDGVEPGAALQATAALVELADVERGLRLGARWDYALAPLENLDPGPRRMP